jgi:S1-C subfamily serine protease
MLVLQVAEGSPGARMGLRGGTTKARIGNARLILGGDIILQVMGIPMHPDIDTYQRIRERVRQLGSGEQITVTVLRRGKIVRLTGSATQ